MQINTAILATIPAVALIAMGCGPRATMIAGRPECPHSWANAFRQPSRDAKQATAGSMSTWTTAGRPQEFLISEGITDIPEFHDCQRLIPNKDGEHAYGRLAAVFARFQLDTLVPMLDRPSDSTPGPRTLAVAEVASEGEYESLGIEVGFNCLLLRLDGGTLSARVVAMGTDHRGFECVQFERAPTPAGARVTELAVLPAKFDRVPPVARWEWDTERDRQLIGVKCGEQRWCVIGPDDPPHPVKSHGLTGAPQGMTAPGWYDEQSLAVAVTDGSAPSDAAPTLLPSGPFSTIFPDEALEQFRRDSYPRHEWIPAAHIAMPQPAPVYGAKLGLAQTDAPLPAASLDGLNQLQFCVGTIKSCKVREADINDPVASGCTKAYIDSLAAIPADARKLPIWARIIPPGSSSDSSKTRYHCVTHREHPEVEIPAVVRWRWRVDDETIWAYCPSGCCEVHSSPM